MFVNPYASRSYLVVDDFGDMRTMIKGLLRTLGATDIDAARNGKEALDLMAKRRYDVTLCDYNLGRGKDGQQVLEEARHRKLIGVANIFVMVTAENTREMVMGVVEYEPDSYLSKPFTKELLRTRLDKLFKRKADLAPISNAIENREFSRAVSLLDEHIKARPRHVADLVKLKAEVLMQAERYDEALGIFERALVERDIPWARLGVGKVQYAKRLYADAAETFQRVLGQNPNVTVAYDWLAKAQRAMGFNQEAKNTIKAAVELSPKVVKRQQLLGELALSTGDVELAEKSYDKAAHLGTNSVFNNPSIYAGLARARSAGGKHDEAKAAVEQMTTTFAADPETAFYAASSEAVILQNEGDADGAAACLERAEKHFLALPQGEARSLGLELASVSAHLGQKEKAENILQSAVRNNHDDNEYLSAVTEVYRQTGLSEDPEHEVTALRKSVTDMNNAGVRLMQGGRFDDAIELFETAAAKMADNRVINLNAARAHIMRMEQRGTDTDSIGKVRRYLERTRQLAPNDERIMAVMKRLQRVVAGH